MKIIQSMTGLCLVTFLSACGGGSGTAVSAGGTGTTANPSNALVLTGVFVDSPVSGINFTTATQSGKTNAKGEFLYVAGENVTFSIGSVQLPAVAANATVTPLDIAKTTDINNQLASNILVLLQSLDEDGNPANGIAIPAAATAKASTAINFDVSPVAFAANATVTGLVADSGSVNKVLIAEATAKTHFQNTLNGTGGSTKINVAPVANAGTIQSVLTGAVITLNGSNSSDANTDTLTYAWTLTAKPAGSSAFMTAATAAKPTFTADKDGIYTATLVVNDGAVNSTASTVNITASSANAAPVANAGTAQNVVAASTVTLNGAASSDANGDLLTYAWTLTSKPIGSVATLANATAVNPTFVADKAGSYVVGLTVNDGKLNSAAATIAVTAAVANVAPVANTGVAQNVVVGSLVTLNGSASSDANGDTLTYAWTLTSKPTGSIAALDFSTTVRPTFTADVAGTYVASLTVNDGKVNSNIATVSVTADVSALTLVQPNNSFFGGSDTVLTMPYVTTSSASGNVTCVGSGCATVYDVESYKLSAVGQSYTITNLQAINLTTGSTITPLFSGLVNNQIIAAGTTVSFKLQSPFTTFAMVNLQYSFTVLETGKTFSYTVQLRTN